MPRNDEASVRPMPIGSGGVRCTACGATAAAGGDGSPIVLSHASECPEHPVRLAAARRAAIVSLLQHRDEHLPEPHRRPESAPGFVHGARARSCPDCLANGKTMKGCETCGGFGTITGQRIASLAVPDELPDDETRLDPYAKEVVSPYGFDTSRHERSRERDRQIDSLEHQLRPASEIDELADANRRGYAWEEQRRRMYRQFDFAALDRATDDLRMRDEDAWHALHALYVNGLVDVSAVFHAAAERGMRFLEERLPSPLRAPGFDRKHPALARRDRKSRDAA